MENEEEMVMEIQEITFSDLSDIHCEVQQDLHKWRTILEISFSKADKAWKSGLIFGNEVNNDLSIRWLVKQA